MKIGDLVTFCPEAWGTPLEDRPLGVVTNVWVNRDRTHNDFAAVRFEQAHFFTTDFVGHNKYAFVSALSSDDGETNSGVARSWFDAGSTRLQEPSFLRFIDHRDRRTIFGTAAWIRRF